MAFLTERNKKTLAAIADTLLPELRAAGDHHTAGALSLNVQRLLKMFLRLIQVPLVNGLTARRWRAFSAMSLQDRAHILRVWCDSPLELMRRAFQGVKRITLFLCYSTSPNPTWGHAVCRQVNRGLSSR